MKHRHREAFARELAAVPVFAMLDESDVQLLAANATRAREPRGMVLSREGERGDLVHRLGSSRRVPGVGGGELLRSRAGGGRDRA